MGPTERETAVVTEAIQSKQTDAVTWSQRKMKSEEDAGDVEGVRRGQKGFNCGTLERFARHCELNSDQFTSHINLTCTFGFCKLIVCLHGKLVMFLLKLFIISVFFLIVLEFEFALLRSARHVGSQNCSTHV